MRLLRFPLASVMPIVRFVSSATSERADTYERFGSDDALFGYRGKFRS
jgi:hypothetical protein